MRLRPISNGMDEFVIKNGLVYKGDGSDLVETDILVKEERITGLLKATKKNSLNVVDARGMVVTPGFVEINFEAEREGGILDDVYSMNLVKKGVTSAIGGSNGVSLAPIFSQSVSFLKSIYSSKFNADWQSVKDFFSVLKRRGVGINFGTLVGYATVRSAFVGNEGRDLTDGEIESLGRIIASALGEGALGVAFDLSEPYLNGVSSDEIFRVMNAAGVFKNVFAFHLRDERRAVESTEEILSLSKAHDLNIEINHFQPLRGFEDQYVKAVSEIEKNSAEKSVRFDVFPGPLVKLPIYDLLPAWIKGKNLKDLTAAAESKHLRERLLADLAGIAFENLTIAEAPSPLKFLEGRNMRDFASTRNVTSEEALLDLAVLTKMRATLFSDRVDTETLSKLMESRSSILSLSYHDAEKENPAVFGDIISSGKMVEKITSLPARKYGLQRRGLIKEGYFADVVVFKDEKPFYVFVNGKMVMKEGRVEPQFSGRILGSQSAR